MTDWFPFAARGRSFAATLLVASLGVATVAARPAAARSAAVRAHSQWAAMTYTFDATSGCVGATGCTSDGATYDNQAHTSFDDGDAHGTTDWGLSGGLLYINTKPRSSWSPLGPQLDDTWITTQVVASLFGTGSPGCDNRSGHVTSVSLLGGTGPAVYYRVQTDIGFSSCPLGTNEIFTFDRTVATTARVRQMGGETDALSGCGTGTVHDAALGNVNGFRFSGNSATDTTAKNCIIDSHYRATDGSGGSTVALAGDQKVGFGAKMRFLGATDVAASDSEQVTQIGFQNQGRGQLKLELTDDTFAYATFQCTFQDSANMLVVVQGPHASGSTSWHLTNGVTYRVLCEADLNSTASSAYNIWIEGSDHPGVWFHASKAPPGNLGVIKTYQWMSVGAKCRNPYTTYCPRKKVDNGSNTDQLNPGVVREVSYVFAPSDIALTGGSGIDASVDNALKNEIPAA